MNSTRRGASLLELLVAMPLLLLISAVAMQLFVTQLQLGDRVGRRAHNLRELEQAVSALAFDVRGATALDLESWTASTLVVQAPILSGYVCGVPTPRTVDVVAVAVHPLGSTQHAPPTAGDRITVPARDSALAGLPLAVLDSALQSAQIQGVTRESTACTGSPLQDVVGGTPYRIRLATALVDPPNIGAAVQLSRRTEWRAYRGRDGAYYLGRRDWDSGGWNTTQPVVGPLLPNRAGGFRVHVRRLDGRALATADREAAWLEVELRMPRPSRHPGQPHYDSLRAQLALRGGQ